MLRSSNGPLVENHWWWNHNWSFPSKSFCFMIEMSLMTNATVFKVTMGCGLYGYHAKYLLEILYIAIFICGLYIMGLSECFRWQYHSRLLFGYLYHLSYVKINEGLRLYTLCLYTLLIMRWFLTPAKLKCLWLNVASSQEINRQTNPISWKCVSIARGYISIWRTIYTQKWTLACIWYAMGNIRDTYHIYEKTAYHMHVCDWLTAQRCKTRWNRTRSPERKP